MNPPISSSLLLLAIIMTSPAGSCDVSSMLDTNSRNTNQQWNAFPLLTIGDQVAGYTPPGRLDGLGAFQLGDKKVQILANHEIAGNDGYTYKLKNGTELSGARISFFDVRSDNFQIANAGIAYDAIVDRQGDEVSDAAQINEGNNGKRGLSKLCSARSIQAGDFGFVDDIYFAGEEAKQGRSHPHGGSLWALDVHNRTLHALPALGRGAWENVTPLETGNSNSIALLMSDDTGPAPLYLFIGKKESGSNAAFLQRNGLNEGQLYCWKSDTGHVNPETFNRTGTLSTGHFIPVKSRLPEEAGNNGYDRDGYLDSDSLRKSSFDKGCFQFSRPEDLHNDPEHPDQAIFASTGKGNIHPSDDWGTLYFVAVSFDNSDHNKIAAELMIAYDSDDDGKRDNGIRSPDNLTWADNKLVYVQEDKATRLNTFGANGIESSIWQFDPRTLTAERIAEINRKAVFPAGATDRKPNSTGSWESTGIIDVTHYFDTLPEETLLLTAVQAHKVGDGPDISGKQLVESGQLIFLTNKHGKP